MPPTVTVSYFLDDIVFFHTDIKDYKDSYTAKRLRIAQYHRIANNVAIFIFLIRVENNAGTKVKELLLGYAHYSCAGKKTE